MPEPEFGFDVDGRWKMKSMFVRPDAPVASSAPVVTLVGTVQRLHPHDNQIEGTSVTRVTPIASAEFDPSFPSRAVAPFVQQRVVPLQTAPVEIDYSNCPRCHVRHEASQRKNARARAREKARKARAKGGQ